MPANKNQINEEDLWKDFLMGSDSSLEKIYRIYFDQLFNYGKKWLTHADLTEDCIQDLFIKLLTNRKNLSEAASVKYYLFRSFRSVVLDKLKSQSKLPFILKPDEFLFELDVSGENNLIDEEEYQSMKMRLSDALKSLTPRQREAIFLKYTQGFSYHEVAALMKLTPKGTYKLMARALDALRRNVFSISLILFHKILFNSI